MPGVPLHSFDIGLTRPAHHYSDGLTCYSQSGMPWEPTTFNELKEVLAAGTIAESASLEFKSSITNDKLARLVASLAINGGTLLIGVEDDGNLVPVELDGEPERIDQVLIVGSAFSSAFALLFNSTLSV